MKKKFYQIVSILISASVFFAIFFFLQKEIRRDFKVLKREIQQSSFLTHLSVDPGQVERKAQIRTLNRQMPDFEYLAELAKDKSVFSERALQNHVRYYERVTEYMPGLAEAWGLLGFSYHFYPNRSQDAIEAYQKAIHLNPHFFWFYHNLGVLYFEQADFTKAVFVSEKALGLDLKLSSKFISSSRYVYKQSLSAYFKKYNETLEDQFQRGYKQTLLMLLLSYDQLEQYQRMVPVAFKVIDIDKEIAYFYLGKATFHLKQYARSSAFLKLCLDENPRNTDALQYLALNLKAMGKDKVALKTLQQMVALIKMGKEKLPTIQPFNLEMY